jgi:hypothetical protein
MHFATAHFAPSNEGEKTLDQIGKERNKSMLKTEREALLKVNRQRARLAKQAVDALTAERKYKFLEQLAREYSWDEDKVWKEAYEECKAVVADARKKIADRNEAKGIPRWAAPSVSLGWWGQGQNAVREFCAKMIRLHNAKTDEQSKKSKLHIDQVALGIEEKLLTGGLETDAAKAFLESMPTPETLMPAITVAEVKREIEAPESDEDEDD